MAARWGGFRRGRGGGGARGWRRRLNVLSVRRRRGAGRPGRRRWGAGGSRRPARGRREGGARAGGRRWPRQVGPTCRRLRERGGGGAGRLWAESRWAAAGKGDWVDLLFFPFFFFFFSIPFSNLLNSKLFHLFKLKF
jgi:hypothetical protein